MQSDRWGRVRDLGERIASFGITPGGDQRDKRRLYPGNWYVYAVRP